MLFKYKYHIFCCQNHRDSDNPKGCCLAKNSQAILEFFKKTAHDQGLKKTVRITKCGCLAACRFGPSVVVYPEGTWYTIPTVEAAKEVFEKHILGGRPVERFFMKEEEGG